VVELATLCPVCGYDLKLPSPTETIERCPSCGFNFQRFQEKLPFNEFDENNLFVRIRRTTWAETHFPWCAKDIQPPENWDPIKQMFRIGIKLAESLEDWNHNNPVISPDNNEKFLELAVKQIEQLDWTPQVIEALWDGDTQGWFLEFMVSAKDNEQTDHYPRLIIFSLRGAGGDIRALNMQVPPWPESQIATFVGQELAKQLKIPFYFPSPEQPDDDCAGWWERNEETRCISCGKYLNMDLGQDICYPCKQKQRKS
jgi:hypothetical protein